MEKKYWPLDILDFWWVLGHYTGDESGFDLNFSIVFPFCPYFSGICWFGSENIEKKCCPLDILDFWWVLGHYIGDESGFDFNFSIVFPCCHNF